MKDIIIKFDEFVKNESKCDNHEQYMNDYYTDNFKEGEAVKQLIYLTNKSRGKAVSEKTLRKAYQDGKLGTLLKKLDPIAFNVSKNDVNESKKTEVTKPNIDKVIEAYLVAALFTEEEQVEGIEDKTIYNFSDKAKKRAKKDIEWFIEKAGKNVDGIDDEMLGHDIWLSRNRHGAGFFDRGYDDVVEKNLMKIAHELGETTLEINGDDEIEFYGGKKINESVQQKDFVVGDVVYDAVHDDIGIVLLPEEKGEIKLDSDGNVDASKCTKLNKQEVIEFFKDGKIEAPSIIWKLYRMGYLSENDIKGKIDKVKDAYSIKVAEKSLKDYGILSGSEVFKKMVENKK